MSPSPSKKSSEEAHECSQPPSQPPSQQDRIQSFLSAMLRFGGRKRKSGESNSSTDVSKKEVPSQGPDGKTVFKPKHLTICWEGDSQFWSIPEGDGPAELLKVCWLDVSGEMPVTKGKEYEVSFMLSMNTKNSSAWDDPVTVMARIGKKGEYQRKEIKLSNLGEEVKEFRLDHKCQTKSKSDENAKNDEETLYFGLYEVWTNKWKRGLRIHEAIVQEIAAGNNIASTSEIPAGNNIASTSEIAAHDD